MTKPTIEQMQELAKQRGGKCLSTEYINTHTKLKWQCKEGHIWENTPAHIKAGQWCRKCAAKKLGHQRRSTIDEMQEIARQRGGKCLSTEYVSTHTKLKWQCKEGHTWANTPAHIKAGQWCPKCGHERGAQKQKLKIEEMHEIASQRGGKCLSTAYVNARTKLNWQCKEGHVWENTPSHIKAGRWCPTCSRKKRSKSDQQQ